MENRKNRTYAIILIVATVLFMAGMVTCIYNLKYTASSYSLKKVATMTSNNSDSLGERLDYMKDYVDRRGPEVIYNELYYGHNYEQEFDDYWEFADIQIAGVRGRFATDNSKYRKIIEDYIANCSDGARREAAEGYLALMD